MLFPTWAVLCGHLQALGSTQRHASQRFHIQKGAMPAEAAVEACHAVCHSRVYSAKVGRRQEDWGPCCPSPALWPCIQTLCSGWILHSGMSWHEIASTAWHSGGHCCVCSTEVRSRPCKGGGHAVPAVPPYAYPLKSIKFQHNQYAIASRAARRPVHDVSHCWLAAQKWAADRRAAGPAALPRQMF